MTLELFRETYDFLLSLTRKELPDTKIILCTPFVLPVDKIGKDWDLWSSEVGRFAAVVTDLARKHGASLIQLQQLFDAALAKAPASFWIPDGVHPSAPGHQLIADEWIRVV